MDSISAVKKFKEAHNLIDGKFFTALIDVETASGKYKCADTCECFFTYSVSYEQYELCIMWSYNDNQLKNLGLRKGYNTNHHNIDFKNNMLIIHDTETVIVIEQEEMEVS